VGIYLNWSISVTCSGTIRIIYLAISIIKAYEIRLVKQGKQFLRRMFFCKISELCSKYLKKTPTNPHWARVVGYGPFSLWIIHKEGLCPSCGDIKRLMMILKSNGFSVTLKVPLVPWLKNSNFWIVGDIYGSYFVATLFYDNLMWTYANWSIILVKCEKLCVRILLAKLTFYLKLDCYWTP
jgi:hypothetical protein